MDPRQQPLDATIHVVTPEHIAFEYRLAGPFQRLPAFFLDLCIQVAFLIVLMIVLGMTVGLASPGTAMFVFFVMLLVVWWFYGVLFETFFNGQTPGKYVLGLRVLTDNGQPINGLQATLRNLLRAADLVVPMIGLFVTALNRKYQRLGDLVAGTMVIVEERQWLTGVAKLDDPRAIQLAAYLPPNFVVMRSLAKSLATYVERRRFFTPPRRREVARHLAVPLLDRFGLPSDTSYDLLLCALYYRTFIADRSQDERLLAEAQAALAANPFGQMSTVPQPAAPAYVAPPLVQEHIIGTGLGGELKTKL
jgi:uncharacterized RDD family membrane protein YckC